MAPKSEILSIVHDYLKENGFKSAAKKLKKELDEKSISLEKTDLKLDDIYQAYQKSNNSVAKKEQQEATATKSDDESSNETVNQVEESANENTEEVKPVSKKEKYNETEEQKAERFKRVREEEVEFLDERLRDNTFLSKPGAVNSYGHKAHQDLVVTKGKGFLKAKNKKKKGSYRGGAIDLGSHSIKFDD